MRKHLRHLSRHPEYFPANKTSKRPSSSFVNVLLRHGPALPDRIDPPHCLLIPPWKYQVSQAKHFLRVKTTRFNTQYHQNYYSQLHRWVPNDHCIYRRCVGSIDRLDTLIYAWSQNLINSYRVGCRPRSYPLHMLQPPVQWTIFSDSKPTY